MTDTRRMDCCGLPACDHVPWRYPFKVWWKHLMLRAFSPWLSKIEDTSPW